jgi:hypothetical protein
MSGHLKFRFTIDGLVKSQKSDDNMAALPELGQGAQPGRKKLQMQRNAADGLPTNLIAALLQQVNLR